MFIVVSLIIIIIVLIYQFHIDSIKDNITDTKLTELTLLLSQKITSPIPQVIKITTTDTVPPVRIYDSGNKFQQIGFVYDSTRRFPLFSRNKFPNKSDKKEYYILDELIKIPFKSLNDYELYDGDTIVIKELNNSKFTIEVYDIESIKYNPNF